MSMGINKLPRLRFLAVILAFAGLYCSGCAANGKAKNPHASEVSLNASADEQLDDARPRAI